MTTVEKVEKNKMELTIEVPPARFQEGLKYSYNKNKGMVSIPGFRSGKAPRKVIERMYGASFFYDDAINYVLPEAYAQALDEVAIEPVYKPDVRIEEASEEKGVIFVAEVYVKPEVTIDGYYGLTYPKPDTEPNESEIQEKLQAEREKNARTISVERPAENGDIVTINFAGSVGGELFEGGTGENYDLTLGSHTFIDTFEDQLLGHSVGDDVDVQVTFPEDYGHEELAGKEAVFAVEILDIKMREYPEVNDEFAQDVSEFDTLAEYRDSLADIIKEEKVKKAEQIKQAHVLRQLVGKAVMDVPEVMYKARAEEMLEDFRFRIERQGMDFAMYLQFAQMTEEKLLKSYEGSAKESVDAMLALGAVAEKEELTVSEEEYRDYMEKVTNRIEKDLDEWLSKIPADRKKELMQDCLYEKAIEFIMAQAVAVENTPNFAVEGNPDPVVENTPDPAVENAEGGSL